MVYPDWTAIAAVLLAVTASMFHVSGRAAVPCLTPCPGRYVAGYESTAAAAQMEDQAHVWPPYTAQSPEPDAPAYRDCALKLLIERAQQKSDANAAAIRDFYNAAVPKPGYS